VAVAADRIGGFVAEASRRFSIPASWIRAVMRVESLGDPLALSPKGAMGLMQIMPDTWSELRSRYGLGADPYDARDNIMAGTAYLREMHDRFGERGFLAAYNAGPSRYQDHLATGRPLPSETLLYVAAVGSLIGVRIDDGEDVGAVLASSWTAAPLFVTRLAPGSLQIRPTSRAQMPKGLVGETVQDRTELAPLSDGLFAKPTARDRRP
jgi:Transglycosylase SLT domain